MFSKRILLFDIDGTLTKSSKTVGSDVLLQTVSQTYGKKMEKKDVIYSGGTGTYFIISLIFQYNFLIISKID